ncbi:MAG TPA: post-COAP-1 domain-containing protein [Methylomirabilota bacterium]|nr:post-COAP-1 domain-containing protein [Methylomirabilota bacterium]
MRYLLAAAIVLVGSIVSPAQAQLVAGDAVVIDTSAGTGSLGALFRVDATTGARTLLSDFGNPAQGPLGVDPIGVALEASGQILVTDQTAGRGSLGALFRVDATTGARTLLSDFGIPAQGPLGVDPFGVAVEASGQILVADIHAGTSSLGALFRVDATTGARTLLSDFGNPAQGLLGVDPYGVALEASGQIFVIDGNAGTSIRGALFRVDATTGARTLLSDFGDPAQGPLGVEPVGVALEASGQILVIDPSGGTFPFGGLFRVDATTGARTLLSDFGDLAQGPLGPDPGGVALEASGQILVSDANAGTALLGALFRVDATTGARTLVSDFGNSTQGPLGVQPMGVAVVPAFISTPGKVTGGGAIDPDGTILTLATLLIQSGANPGGKATFGFVVEFTSGSAAPTGNLTYNDHELDVRIKAIAYELLVITDPSLVCPLVGKHAKFTGTADVNGVQEMFEVEVDDCGEPGDTDTFSITTESYMASGVLIGGNIQIHQ